MVEAIYQKVAEMFLKRYRDRVVQKVRMTSDLQRFKRVVESNALASELVRLSQRLCLIYENTEWHSIVLETLDLDLIYGNVDKQVQESGEDYTDSLVKELLRYFKQDFFKWVNSPICKNCRDKGVEQNQKAIGVARAMGDEVNFECGAVEVYQCSNCGTKTRFPRYNDPIKLLETRTGRCGEFCNTFALILKSFGLETRYIWNREDHVWCEYYSENLKKWVHLDSCEQAFDEPHIYSVNWNKKMSYCIAFDNHGVTDVSKRYILKNELPRDQISEEDLRFLCEFLTKNLRSKLTDNEIYKLAMRDIEEQLSWVSIKKNDSNEPSVTKTSGRITGSAEWKAQRGEDGK